MKRYKNPVLALWLPLLFFTCLSSCVSVKEYQKVYLNDSEMELSPRRVENPEMNFQLYREGSSGGNGGKSSGGCGCN
ncbi:MAG: DUF4266 domain-containing protein [Cytophagaceae bacterium]